MPNKVLISYFFALHFETMKYMLVIGSISHINNQSMSHET